MLHRNRACKYDAQQICYRAYNSDAQQGLQIWCSLQICCTGPANMLHKTSTYDAQGLQI